MTHVLVGLGECLWDLLPAGKKLGGAPANFAYHAQILGSRGIVASRVGNDALGKEALDLLAMHGLDLSYIQRDDAHPTGSVAVTLDASGQAQYTFAEDVAWDHFAWSPQWQSLAEEADAVCFGTLAQRHPASAAVIDQFLAAVPERTLRVFDVNLRASFYSGALIERLLHSCDLLKLNHQELPILGQLLGLKGTGDDDRSRELIERFGMEMVCTTKGEDGSVFVTKERVYRHPGYRVTVEDTVGAGDAFCATLIHYFLLNEPIEAIADLASRRGAWVATQSGAMPPADTYEEPPSCCVPAFHHA